MTIAVLGAGAWGTALAIRAAAGSTAASSPPGQAHAAATSAAPAHCVRLWARDEAQRADMQACQQNQRYLPGFSFPPHLQVSQAASLRASDSPLAGADLVIVAAPMAGLRGMLEELAQSPAPVAWLCKGFEAPITSQPTAGHAALGLMGHEILARTAPGLRAGVLSGPSFAQEVAQGLPCALVAASAHPSVRQALAAAFHSASLRVYGNEDIIGVEVAGAVKNVLAIATGFCDGLGLGLNARAALITRGLSEMTRLGVALGGQVNTFMGLSGLGDLVLTATGELSRNRKVGHLLAQGLSLQEALNRLGHVAEGVYSAHTVVQRAHALGVDMPISQTVVALLQGRLQGSHAVAALMQRGPKDELF